MYRHLVTKSTKLRFVVIVIAVLAYRAAVSARKVTADSSGDYYPDGGEDSSDGQRHGHHSWPDRKVSVKEKDSVRIDATSLTPSISPSLGNATTISPSPTAPPSTNNATVSPSPSAPPPISPDTPSPTTEAPTRAPSDDDGRNNNKRRHRRHWMMILLHTIGWLLLAGASLLAFGACFGNRYRIYYYVRGMWYSFLRSDKTQWIVSKLRVDGWVYGRRTAGSGGGGSSSLNDIIFEGGGEGLLMRET